MAYGYPFDFLKIIPYSLVYVNMCWLMGKGLIVWRDSGAFIIKEVLFSENAW